MFQCSVYVVVENGASAKFWTDKWLPARAIPSFAPNLFRAVGRRRLGRTVREALADRRWIRDITGARTAPVLYEYVQLWRMLQDVQLRPMEEDRFVWRWTADGQFTVRSASRAYFVGWTSMAGAVELWRAAAPPRMTCSSPGGCPAELHSRRPYGEALIPRVFDGRSRTTTQLVQDIMVEADAWIAVGFRDLGLLTALAN